MKLSEQSEETQVAIINAARDMTVAKIHAKGKGFDGYTRHMNWFNQSLQEVMESLNEQEKVKS